MSDEKPDVWSGQLIDATGLRGSVEVTFDVSRPVVSWKLQVFSRDGDPTDLKGEADVADHDPRQGASVELRVTHPDTGQVTMRFEFETAEAGNYAHRALLGRYRVGVESAQAPFPLSQGVLALWRFAQDGGQR